MAEVQLAPTTAVPLRPVDALRVRDLRVVHDGTEVLRGTDLDLRTGEWLGLIGPNGSGKSTLLRALVGLVPSTGTVELGTGSLPGPTDLLLSADRRTLYVHVMHMKSADQTRRDIKDGFERRVKSLFE